MRNLLNIKRSSKRIAQVRPQAGFLFPGRGEILISPTQPGGAQARHYPPPRTARLRVVSRLWVQI